LALDAGWGGRAIKWRSTPAAAAGRQMALDAGWGGRAIK